MVERRYSWTTTGSPHKSGTTLPLLKDVLLALQQLTLEVEETVTTLEEEERRKKETMEADFVVGNKVRVIRRDKYYGRVGEIIGRRGQLFWRVLLTEGARQEIIYKKPSGLEVLMEE
jgi:hypothetical protein